MDYATTFCDYSETEPCRLPAAVRPASAFPPAVSARMLLLGSAALQILMLWSVFLVSLDTIDNFRDPSFCIFDATVLTAAFALYWFSSGMFTPAHVTSSVPRQMPFTVLLNSFACTGLAMVLFCLWQHPASKDAVTSAVISCIAIMLLAAGGVPFTRQLMQLAIRHQRLACDIVLAGDPTLMRDFIRHMRENHAGVRICAAFNLSNNPKGSDIEDVPLRHGIAELLSFHAHYPKPRVILLPNFRGQGADIHLALLRLQPLHVFSLHKDFSYADADHTICVAGVPGVKLQLLQTPPLSSFTFLFKDIFDRAAGLAALILLAPIMLACAIIIKLTSPGPVLYRQKRIGFRNKLFNVYKFRSMHVDDCDKLTLTKRGDNRVFAAGRVMRRLSLDELPQLFNVIRGEMSLVGPRPHMREARAGNRLYYEVVVDYGSRHCVKPGITGWAQINGWRGPTDTEDSIRSRVEHDLYYIENWSFWLDLKILFRTVAGGFSGSNAV